MVNVYTVLHNYLILIGNCIHKCISPCKTCKSKDCLTCIDNYILNNTVCVANGHYFY